MYSYEALSKDKFEIVEILGVNALFVQARLDPNTIPAGLYMYDMRGDENGDWMYGGSIEPHVWVNWVASSLVKNPIEFKDDTYRIEFDEEGSPNITGDEMTIRDFLDSDY